MKNRNIALLVVLLLVADQALKIWIKTHLALGESITVFPDWFFLRFIENPGAAFGFELGGNNGKLFLSLFRIVAIGALCWFIPYLNRKTADKGLIVGFVLILAGAIGNMIDSAFYGMIFSESTPWGVAELFPEAGGYASFLHGKVVDMFYFPLFSGNYPDWFPMVGGNPFTFFAPVFNLADSYITVAVFYLLIFKYKALP